MTNLKLWGTPDIFSQDFCTISTSTPSFDPADKPPSNLKTEEPSEVACRNTLNPEHTRWLINMNNLNIPVEGIALINHNLVAGDYVRFTLDSQGTGPTTQIPNAIATSTNLGAGGITNVDEDIDAPDGLVLGPATVTLQWSIRFSWAPLSATPKTGTAMGQFVVDMRREFYSGGNQANTTTYPFVKAELYESGSLKTLLGHRAISIDTGTTQMFVFPFDFADLTQPNGTDLEFQLTVNPGFCSSGGSYGTLDTILMIYEDAAIALNNDSGYIQIPELGSVDAPTKSIHYIPPVAWNNTFEGSIMILSDQADKNPLKYSSSFVPVGLITQPSTFVQAGKVCGGELLGDNITVQPPGVQVAIHTEEEAAGRTKGGQSYGADSFRYRYAKDVKLSALRDEKDRILDLLNWQRGLSGAFYVVFEPDVTLERQLFSSFYATLSEDIPPPTELGGWRANNTALYEITLSVEEKL